jgi:hypothetical protein
MVFLSPKLASSIQISGINKERDASSRSKKKSHPMDGFHVIYIPLETIFICFNQFLSYDLTRLFDVERLNFGEPS